MNRKTTDVVADRGCTQDDRLGEGRISTEKIWPLEDFFFPSSAGYGCSAGSLMWMVKACEGHDMTLAEALWNVS